MFVFHLLTDKAPAVSQENKPFLHTKHSLNAEVWGWIVVSRFMLSSRVMQFTRVPNRFFGIRDLAYFKVGIWDFEGKGGRDIRDCNYDRDSGYGDFNKRESGNAA